MIDLTVAGADAAGAAALLFDSDSARNKIFLRGTTVKFFCYASSSGWPAATLWFIETSRLPSYMALAGLLGATALPLLFLLRFLDTVSFCEGACPLFYSPLLGC